MQKFEYVIQDIAGIHARPAGMLCRTAQGYQSECTMVYQGQTVSLKDLMDIMFLGVPKGAEIIVTAEGSDEVAAAAGIKAFFEAHL